MGVLFVKADHRVTQDAEIRTGRYALNWVFVIRNSVGKLGGYGRTQVTARRETTHANLIWIDV